MTKTKNESWVNVVEAKLEYKKLLPEATIEELTWMNKQINKEIVRRLQETEDR